MRARVDPARLRLITLDLDDTLWPIEHAIARAEEQLHGWFATHCPPVAARFAPDALRALRRDVETLHPELRGDITALRRRSIELALERSDADVSLVDAAFDVFWRARNAVECFEDVLPALKRLKAKYRVGAITNGNACVKLAGLGEYFDFALSARDAGCAKPARDIFLRACATADVLPGEALHAGDDLDCDVRGALAAGMHAAWIQRDTSTLRVLAPPALTVPDLATLADRLAA